MKPNLLKATLRPAAEAIYDDYGPDWRKQARNACSAWERLTDNLPIGKVTPEDFAEFLIAMADVGLSEPTQRHYGFAVEAILNKVRGRDFIFRAGSKRRGKPPANDPEPATLDETLWSHFHLLYRRFRLVGKAKQTETNYRINLRHFGKFLGRPATLTDLNDQNIIDGMHWLLSRGRSPATANKFKVAMCSLWNFLAKRAIVKDWPTVQLMNVPDRIPRAWTQSQLGTLFDALGKQKRKICGLPAAEWWICLHLFLWNTAERLTAAMMLRVDDVRLCDGWVTVRAETRKYQRRDKSHRLHAETLVRIRRLVAADPDRELMFPRDCCINTLFNRYRRILKKAGLPHGSRDMFHKMRRSAISHFEAAGGNGTKLADHGNSAVTRKSYIDPTIVVEQQAADLLFQPTAIMAGGAQ